MPNKICIIGAGVSGLATIKALKDAGIESDCFDIASDIGGLWKYHSDNGVAANKLGTVSARKLRQSGRYASQK